MRCEAEGELENWETVEPKEKRWKMCLYGEKGWGVASRYSLQKEVGLGNG